MPTPKKTRAAATMRNAATHMRFTHGPDHPRHEMWDAMAALLDYHATLADERASVGQPVTADAEHVYTVARAYLAATK